MRGLLCLLVVALLAAVPAHCRHLKWSSPSAGPSQQCIASFNTMVQSGLCSQGSTMPVCCSAMAAVGDSCLDSMEAAMAQDPSNYGQLLDITKSLRSQCASTGAGTGSSAGPTSQCISDFTALVQSSVCGQGSTQAQCCAALDEVGSACLDSIEADLATYGDKYAQLLQTTKALRSQCGAGAGSGPVSGPGSGTGSTDECVNGLMDAFDGACTSVSSCCDALEGLGTGCLTWFLEEVKDDAQVHDAFATLLESCEITSSRSSSTRAAPQDDATATAMARLQEVGAAKLAAAPQAARAAFQPNLASDWHLDASAAVEQRSAFSQEMLVKA